MKKFLLVVPLLLLAGCSPKSSEPAAAPDTQTQGQAINEASQMAAAVQAGRPVQCVIREKDSQLNYTYKMKDKNIRVSGMTTPETNTKSSMIIADKVMYVWDEEKKTGMKWTIPEEQDVEEMAKQQGQNLPDLSTDEGKKEYEDLGYTLNCTEGGVTDAEFIPPTNVEFIDSSSMMDMSKKMMQNPSATLSPADQDALQKQAEEMMKQYQQ